MQRRDFLKISLKVSSILGASSLLPFTSSSVLATSQTHVNLISCARKGKQDYVVISSSMGETIGSLLLPNRGHGIALAPDHKSAVVFARRPGQYLIHFDTQTGIELNRYMLPEGRHFYGHGAFDKDGVLYVSEGISASSEGVIGVYQLDTKIKRVREISDFGIGPHEVLMHPNGNDLVVALGGIQTQGREKLNLDSMAPRLIYLDKHNGVIKQSIALNNHQLSIRHMAIDTAGLVAIACQYQADEDILPLIYTHSLGEAMAKPLEGEEEEWLRFNDYIGSIAIDDNYIVATSPRGNCYATWHKTSGKLQKITALSDVCGAANASNQSFVLSAGTGLLTSIQPSEKAQNSKASTHWHWDNHMQAF